jgi:hypothetical protein
VVRGPQFGKRWSRILRHVHWSSVTDVSEHRGPFIGNCVPVDTATHSGGFGYSLDNYLIFCSKIGLEKFPSGCDIVRYME